MQLTRRQRLQAFADKHVSTSFRICGYLVVSCMVLLVLGVAMDAAGWGSARRIAGFAFLGTFALAFVFFWVALVGQVRLMLRKRRGEESSDGG